MSMMTRLSRWFGHGQRDADRTHAERNGHADRIGRAGEASGQWDQDRQVEVKWDAAPVELDDEGFEINADGPSVSDDAGQVDAVVGGPREERAEALTPAPKNKQELLNELRKNYAEVVALVRKVDQHLDQQSERSVRMLQLAERLPEAIERLDAMSFEQGATTAAVNELAVAVREGQGAIDRAVREGHERLAVLLDAQRQVSERQVKVLGMIETRFDAAEAVQRELGQTLHGFGQAMSGLSANSDRLGSALGAIETRGREQDERIEKLTRRTQAMTGALVVACCVGATAAIVAAVSLVSFLTS